MVKPTENAKTILKIEELFVSGDVYYMAGLFYTNMLKYRYNRLGLELSFIYKVFCCYQYILLHMR